MHRTLTSQARSLRLAALPSTMHLLAPPLAQWQRQHPEVTLTVRDPLNDALVAALHNGDYRATSINVDGTSKLNDSGDVPVSETLSAMGKTLGAACGVAGEALDLSIRGGKPVAGSLTTG